MSNPEGFNSVPVTHISVGKSIPELGSSTTGPNALVTLLDTIRATIWEEIQKQPPVTILMPGPSVFITYHEYQSPQRQSLQVAQGS